MQPPYQGAATAERIKQLKPRMLHKLNASWPITSSLRGCFRQRRNTSGTSRGGFWTLQSWITSFLSLLCLPRRLGYLLGAPCVIDISYIWLFERRNGSKMCIKTYMSFSFLWRGSNRMINAVLSHLMRVVSTKEVIVVISFVLMRTE